MRAITEAAADVFDNGGHARASPAVSKHEITKHERGHGEEKQEDSNNPLPVREAGAAGEGPHRKARHERGHARDPPFDPIATLQEVAADVHVLHEVSTDTGHQKKIADEHHVIYRLN